MEESLSVGDQKTERIYSNAGNEPLLRLLSRRHPSVLDVGCGAGDNARLLKRMNIAERIVGITVSAEEKKAAMGPVDTCLLHDVEEGVPPEIEQAEFDLLLFSHVLEHLSAPQDVLRNFCSLLRDGGTVLIAVPNVLQWKQRLRFLGGHFEYTEDGTMDSTHLRFFTYHTADRYTTARVDSLELVQKRAVGWFPLGGGRELLTEATSSRIDRAACRLFPNVFGYQVIMKSRKAPDAN